MSTYMIDEGGESIRIPTLDQNTQQVDLSRLDATINMSYGTTQDYEFPV